MEFANNRNTGDSTSTSRQTDLFNNLYYFTSRNDAVQKQENATRVNKTKYMTYVQNNVDNQLPNSLYANGRPYQQEFQSMPFVVRPMSYYENGRNLSLFRATNDRYIDVSGTMYRNADLRVTPVATTKISNILPVKDIKVATNEWVRSKTGMASRIYPQKIKEINNNQMQHLKNTENSILNERYNIKRGAPVAGMGYGDSL